MASQYKINLAKLVIQLMEERKEEVGINDHYIPYLEVIQSIRLSKNVNQKEIAEFIGISQNAYSKMERGYVNPTYERLEKIAQFLEFDIKEIEKIANEYCEHNVVEESSETTKLRKQKDKVIDDYKTKVEYLEQTVESQKETIQLLKEKIAMLESKK